MGADNVIGLVLAVAAGRPTSSPPSSIPEKL